MNNLMANHHKILGLIDYHKQIEETFGQMVRCPGEFKYLKKIELEKNHSVVFYSLQNLLDYMFVHFKKYFAIACIGMIQSLCRTFIHI